MNRQLLCCLLILVLHAHPLLSQNFNAQSELRIGIEACENGKYWDAIDPLERAVALGPKDVTAHYYLAQAYDNAYGEECDWHCEANERRRVRAIEEFSKVLELDPSNVEAMKALAWRHFRSANRDEAERFYRRILEIDANDVEALYTLAVMGWQDSYQARQIKRVEINLATNKALINLPLCADIRAHNLDRVQESMDLMTRADRLSPSYEAESYLSPIYKERADIQCDDRSAHDRDVKNANDWARRACKTRRKS